MTLFWGGVFGASFLLFVLYERCKTPPKKSYSECLRQTQIRWVIWRSSTFTHILGGHRKPQIFAEIWRFSQKTTGNRSLGSITWGLSPDVQPYLVSLPLCNRFMASAGETAKSVHDGWPGSLTLMTTCKAPERTYKRSTGATQKQFWESCLDVIWQE